MLSIANHRELIIRLAIIFIKADQQLFNCDGLAFERRHQPTWNMNLLVAKNLKKKDIIFAPKGNWVEIWDRSTKRKWYFWIDAKGKHHLERKV